MRNILLCTALALLTAAPGLAENTVEVLPTTPPAPVILVEDSPYAFENLEAYFQEAIRQGYTTDGRFNYELPQLTQDEIDLLPALQARYEAGERPRESVLNKTENVHAALITLPADLYEGESWFLILPNRAMTEEELFQVVDAFAQLGEILRPEALSWRNCLRMPVEALPLRSFRGDENERYAALKELYNRGGLRAESAFTRLPSDDGVGSIGLDEEDFNGLNEMRFFPARRLTDEELLQLIGFWEGEPSAPAADMARYESQLRYQLSQLMGMPLSAKRTEEKLMKANGFDVYGDERPCYYAVFQETGGSGRQWSGFLCLEDSTLINAQVYLDRRPILHDINSDIRLNPYDQRWADEAVETVAALRPDQPDFLDKAQCWCQGTLNSLAGALVRVWTKDGGCYQVLHLYCLDHPAVVYYRDAESIQHYDHYYHVTMTTEVYGTNE